MTLERLEVLNAIVESILEIKRPHPLRVAIDGVDAAGKTTLAKELVPIIERYGRPVIHASIDNFHRPRVDRYRRGANSPEAYYYDSFDYRSLIDCLLIPLGPGGNRKYRRAIYDYRTDKPLYSPYEIAPKDAVLLLDGVFLLRNELNRYWDFRIYVEVNFQVAVGRAVSRDEEDSPLKSGILKRYWEKYVPGHLIYFETVQPKNNATLIVNNNDHDKPWILEI